MLAFVQRFQNYVDKSQYQFSGILKNTHLWVLTTSVFIKIFDIILTTKKMLQQIKFIKGFIIFLMKDVLRIHS